MLSAAKWDDDSVCLMYTLSAFARRCFQVNERNHFDKVKRKTDSFAGRKRMKQHIVTTVSLDLNMLRKL